MNKEEAIKKLENKYGLRMMTPREISFKEKFTGIDKEGYLTYTCIEFLRSNKGGYRKWHKSNPYSIYNINLYFKNIGVNLITLEEEYVSLKYEMKWVCPNCGQVFKCGLGHIIADKKYQCNTCGKEIEIKKRTKSYDIEEVFLQEGLKPFLNETTNRHSQITALTEEGYLIIGRYYNVKKDSYSPKIIDRVHNPYSFYNIQKCIEINNIPCKLISKDYEGENDVLEFECECGEHFMYSFSRMLTSQKFHCNKCNKKVSKGERLVQEWLKENNFNFKTEVRFDDCRHKKPVPFDIVVYKDEETICIEIDGVQHYQCFEFFGGKKRFEERIIIDNIKTDYCEKKGYTLIRIPYWEIRNGEYVNTLIKYFIK